MTFTYNPLSKEDADKAREKPNVIFEKGIYHFETLKKTFKISKQNNQMIELLIKIKDSEGNQNLVKDWLISLPSMEWKTRAYCDATGILDIYEQSQFNENLDVPLKGKVAISIEPGNENPQGGYYPDKNVVDYYVSRDSKEYSSSIDLNELKTEQKSSKEKVDFDDDISF